MANVQSLAVHFKVALSRMRMDSCSTYVLPADEVEVDVPEESYVAAGRGVTAGVVEDALTIAKPGPTMVLQQGSSLLVAVVVVVFAQHNERAMGAKWWLN